MPKTVTFNGWITQIMYLAKNSTQTDRAATLKACRPCWTVCGVAPSVHLQ